MVSLPLFSIIEVKNKEIISGVVLLHFPYGHFFNLISPPEVFCL